MSVAAVYSGPGTSPMSVQDCLDILAVRPGIKVIPGGRDRPYQASLQGEGIQAIKQFVECGGSYLGLCAGAYFAAAKVSFQPGTDLQVCESRDLCFYPGTAWGTVLGPQFQYHSESGASTANLGGGLHVYYNGGCAFKEGEGVESSEERGESSEKGSESSEKLGKSSEKLGEFSEKGGDTSEKVGETSEKLGDASEKSDVSVVCRYEDVSGRPVAVVRRSWGRGRVLLSGVHWEITPDLAEKEGSHPNLVTRLRDSESRRREFASLMLDYLLLEE